MADIPDAKRNVIDLTAEIVAAYVGKNTVTQAELPKLINDVHRALAGAARKGPVSKAVSVHSRA